MLHFEIHKLRRKAFTTLTGSGIPVYFIMDAAGKPGLISRTKWQKAKEISSVNFTYTNDIFRKEWKEHAYLMDLQITTGCINQVILKHLGKT